MAKSVRGHTPEYQRSDGSERHDSVEAPHSSTAPKLLRSAGRSTIRSGKRDEGTETVTSEEFQEPSFSHYSHRDLEGLLHVLIYRIDVLLACLKLADWGDQDFTRVIEETEAILNEGAMYDVGRGMDRIIRAYENVASAAMTAARYSMLAPGFAESADQLQEALDILNEIQRNMPPSTTPDAEPA